MKLKEFPVSILKSMQLKSLSAERLKERDPDSIPVVVSLTSIPSRLNSLHLVIRSVLVQKPKPEKIVLWLHESLQDDIPESLEKLTGEVFEIRYTHLYSSHKKLVHALKAFPNKPIVTCDDDLIYRPSWLRNLYTSHLNHPGKVVGHQLRCIRTDEEGKARPYKTWVLDSDCDNERFLPIGAGGVLYPPETFSELVQDEDLFLKLAPKADDLWFKAVALHEGKQAIKAEESPKLGIPIIGTQRISLKSENIGKDKNRKQWDALAEHFKIQFRNCKS